MGEQLDSAPVDVRSLNGVEQLRLLCDHVDLSIVGDPSLRGEVRIEADEGDGEGLLRRTGNALVLSQRHQPRLRVSEAVLYVPIAACPPIAGEHQNGDVLVERVNAPIQLAHGQGDVRVEAGEGPLRLECNVGDVLVRDRAGPVRLEARHGDVEVVDCRGPISVAVSHGDVAVADCDGDIAVEAHSGDVEIKRPHAARVFVAKRSGDVSIDRGSAIALEVRVSSGDIISTARLLDGQAGQARAGGWDQPPDEAGGSETRSPHVPSEGGSVTVSGRLDLDLEQLGEDLRQMEVDLGQRGEGLAQPRGRAERRGSGERFILETGNGDVSVDLPAGQSFRVEAIAGNGDIESDVPLVSVGRPGPRGRAQRFVGVTTGAAPAGGDGARLALRVRSDRGDIQLRTVAYAGEEAGRGDADDGGRGTPGAGVSRTGQPDTAGGARGTDRDAEVRGVLDALERGEISVADAEALLDALDSEAQGR